MRHARYVAFLAILLLAAPLRAAGADASAADIVVRDDRYEPFSYRVPAPPGARYDENIQGIFLLGHAPFGHAFTGTRAFISVDFAIEPGALFFFSYYAFPKYGVMGDGRYEGLSDMLEDMGLTGDSFRALPPDEQASINERVREMRKNMRFATDPAEILVYLRRIAEWRWNSPNITDFRKNGGHDFLTFLKDAVITTKAASLPAVDDAALATRLEFHIDSEQFLMGRRFLDLSDTVLYFAHGPRVVKIGARDFSARSGEEILAVLDKWRKAIIQANPDMQ